MRYRAILLSLLSLCIVSCASDTAGLKALPASAETLALDHFSIASPGEPGWYLAEDSENAIQLVRKGESRDETYAIQAWNIQLPPFPDDDAFVSFILDGMAGDTDTSRFVVKSNHAVITNTRHGACVGFTTLHEDLSAQKHTGKPGAMLLEVVGITCRNPEHPTDGAHLVYSNRYYPGNRDSMLASRAQSLFDSLDFIN